MGGSVKSQVCHNPEDYAKVKDAGLFWSSYAMGDHYSVDYVMCRGVPTEYFAFYGEKLQHGAFDFGHYNKTYQKRFIEQFIIG